MAETCDSLRQTHQPNPALQSLFHVLDPISLILSQNSSPSNPIPLRLTTESYVMERGPRYRAYAELRETKLRMKGGKQQEREEIEFKQTPSKKQVKFSSSLGISRKGSSVLAQSVPEFSATLRKENRKPAVTSGIELTPPAPTKKRSKGNGVSLPNSRGSKSANAGEKKGRLMMARKSYASVEELKGITLAAANAINGGNRGRKSGGRKVAGHNITVLGYRQF
ncbi:uncharacterized protein LOC111305753 [Durio zibethinus]|uniref:Uncharacterized protein LOC111305753 n=1 Tax=Durio zibethinus TaxID=66656 RepID=A0A6P6A3E3_DURZI|nr:uncharacterized protein LOC111305753 [Durio zibethinus]